MNPERAGPAGESPGGAFDLGQCEGSSEGLSERCGREADTRSGHAKRTREADTRSGHASPLSSTEWWGENKRIYGSRDKPHLRPCHIRGLLPQPWIVATTVDCCRNRGLLPQPWIVAATVDCCRNRGLLPQPWFLAGTVVSRFPEEGPGRRAPRRRRRGTCAEGALHPREGSVLFSQPRSCCFSDSASQLA